MTHDEGKWKQRLSAGVRFSRATFFALSWIFVICIVVQVFIAGMAIFENPVNWERHTNFVHLFELVPILMFILGFTGRLPRMMIWGSLGLFALIFIQYATAHAIASALHPVIALLLFWGSLSLARRSFQLVFRRNGERVQHEG